MARLLMKLGFAVLTSILVILESCSTSPDYQWQGEELYKKETWTIEMQKNESPGTAFTLSGPYLYSSTIKGEAFPEEGGSWIIHLDSLQWFHNHPEGWSEADIQLWGTLRLLEEQGQWKLLVLETPWLESVSNGSIRYKDSVISGDRGRDQLQRRWVRIQSLDSLLHEHLPQSHYTLDEAKYGKRLKAFQRDLGQFLLPEVYGYMEDSEPVNEVERFYARGIQWNGEYSRQILPEEWIELRNSGTLYRDVEEGLPLIWLQYNWQWLWEEQIPTAEFNLERNI